MNHEDKVRLCANDIDLTNLAKDFEQGELPCSIALDLKVTEFVLRDAIDLVLQRSGLDMTYWEFFSACRAKGLKKLNKSLWSLADAENIKAIEMLQKSLYIPEMHDVKKPELVEAMDVSDYITALGSEEAALKFMEDAIKIDQLREEKKRQKL